MREDAGCATIGFMPDRDSPGRPARNVLAGLSLAVATLALALSASTFFNGSVKQTRFEASRQLCVNAITEYGRTLLNIRYRDSPLTPSQQADYFIDDGRARMSCFDTHVLDADSEFAAAWYETERLLEPPIMVMSTELPDDIVGRSAEGVADMSIDRMLGGLEEALNVALTTPGPGFFFWQDPKPTAPPTFPPYELPSPTPAP